MNKEEFIKAIAKMNIDYTEEKLSKLEKYYELLVEWNKKMNLTAITDKKEVYLKHFFDSLTLTKVIDLNKEESLCDIGTGAGFPGIVLKIFFPHLKVTLIDSLNKRLIFLNEVVKVLKLENVEVIHARAEEYALKNREKFDVVTARAVAPLNILLEYSMPLVKKEKYFIALKGHEDENSYKNVLIELFSEIMQVEKFNLPFENSQRTIIKVKKIKNTPLKYPRKYSEIKKHPL